MSSLKKSGWTKEQHRQRHVELHQALETCEAGREIEDEEVEDEEVEYGKSGF